MPSARFGFGILPLTAYRPAAGKVDRVSLAWWGGGSTDPGPVFDGDPDRPRTLVVAWPTDAAGYLLSDTLDQGLVLTWTMDAATFRTLENCPSRRSGLNLLGPAAVLGELRTNGGLLRPKGEPPGWTAVSVLTKTAPFLLTETVPAGRVAR